MPLEEYRRKRDFAKTPEPAPGRSKARKKELSYLIQKHDATRLHYDLRLELDGVLLSWAVTKGPSLDPSDKRLAVRTEDHPLSYGSFEGTIPKGQYGGGTVMLWDKGTWTPDNDPHVGLQKGHLGFELHGERLKGHWDLVRMRTGDKRENWLLIKKKDSASNGHSKADLLENSTSSVKTGRNMGQIAKGAESPRARSKTSGGVGPLVARYPDVQLATLVDAAPDGDRWLHEIKFDGYRLLGFLSQGDVRLRTRNSKDWTSKFPAIATAMADLPAKDAVVDMEAVVLDADGKSSFQSLQNALGDGDQADRIIAFAFDLLHLDGRDLMRMPFHERKAKLKTLLKNTKTKTAIRYSDHVEGNGPKMYAQACEKGLEGIVSKLADAPYSPGRQKSWLKVKCSSRQEFVIVGYSSAKRGERALGALYLGYRKDDEFRYAGKVGTGFTLKSASDLATRLKRIAVKKPAFDRAEAKGLGAGEWASIKWVKPEMLCEVAFTEWTSDGHVRHPSFKGLREDKAATDVRKEKPMQLRTSTSTNQPNKSLIAAGINITHPDRVISEAGHITKGELAAYYEAVSPFMLPSIVRHPLSLLRCPDGIDGEQCFYQRNPGRGLGKDVQPFDFRHKGKQYEYLYIEDEKGLLEVVQMGTIEIHPWGATVDSIDYPDRMIFDLDPAPDVAFDAMKVGARDLRTLLKKKGLETTLKCTGGKGLHVTVALAGKNRWEEVKSFAASIANEMVAASPDDYVATMSKVKRTGKIFIDYFRNDYTATAIADYSVRAHPGAPVATPLDWGELSKLTSASQFTIRDVLQRLKNHKLPAKTKGQVLPSQ